MFVKIVLYFMNLILQGASSFERRYDYFLRSPCVISAFDSHAREMVNRE